MPDYEFEEFLDNALDELNHKQDMLRERYGLEDLSRWWFDQGTEKLQFFDEADRLVVEADVVEVGSYSERSNSWKWALVQRVGTAWSSRESKASQGVGGSNRL